MELALILCEDGYDCLQIPAGFQMDFENILENEAALPNRTMLENSIRIFLPPSMGISSSNLLSPYLDPVNN